MPKTPRNAEYTKEYNRKTVLKFLRTGAMSRAEIARRMGLTRATLSLIADKLLKDGIVKEEIISDTHLGRTPVPLRLCPDSYYAIGVSLNRSSYSVALVNINEEIILSRTGNILDSSITKITMITDCIKNIIKESGVDPEKIVGVGVSSPGPIDSKIGRILNPPSFECWHHTDIAPMLSRNLDMPVHLENDASCLALYHLGKPEAKGSNNFLLLLEDNGIGSGIILNGKILKGNGSFSCELGHTSICHDGKPCSCGNKGCLETYASIGSILSDTAFKSWAEVIDTMDTDAEAMSIVKREASYLSTGIINASNFIGIDTVILAGSLQYGAERLGPYIEATVNESTIHRDRINIRVLPARNVPDVPVLAAADVAFGMFLSV